jgi:manganese oxidase
MRTNNNKNLARWAIVLTCVLGNASAWANAPGCNRLIYAEVVAFEQAVVLNRYGAFNPAGMQYALLRDVVFSGHATIPDGTPVDTNNLSQAPGNVRLREGKRPRPMVLRANETDCLEVRFHNLLMRGVPDERTKGPEQYQGRVPAHQEDPDGKVYALPAESEKARELVKATAVSNDLPRTRAASFHVNGLDVVPVPAGQCPLSTAQQEWVCGMDGDNVGLNRGTVNPATPQPLRDKLEQQGSQVYPGQSAVYRMYAFREGTYFAYSTGATVGGEGDGGQLGAGLFGAVNVQPRGARWYRSQVTHADLAQAARPVAAGVHPFSAIDYDNARYTSGPLRGRPILAMLDGREIVHTDVNAIVALTAEPPDRGDTTGPDRHCKDYAPGTSCGRSYREFTVIMHDEVKAVQAFSELEDPSNPLHYIKDGMGINYGVGGMGAMVVARNRRVGPVKNCPECRAEEFFLSSWANGDPALVLKWDANGKKPIGAMYPDDPSNVHHSYLNDPVRFRNIHAGPKETHVFHLHAHQWVADASAPGSTYLDSQTISPGASFSYEIEFGGSGNRNLSPGDSIFHCHLYPHFAQGMWELWRVHDVFEDGGDKRRLPDAEVKEGTENPALVPLPGNVMALVPTEEFKGYPFYVAGEAGHRPPQPPLDFGVTGNKTADGKDEYVDGGLQRHTLSGWESKGNLTERALANQDVMEAALSKGSSTAQINARRVFKKNSNALYALAEEWREIGPQGINLLEPTGEPKEKAAMSFHAGTLNSAGFTPTVAVTPAHPNWAQENKAYKSAWAATVAGQPAPLGEAVFAVNGRKEIAGAPFADPCPSSAPLRKYKAGVIQTELTVNRHGWFDPQARILSLEQDIKDIIDPNTRDHLPEPLFFRANSGDCIQFEHSNFVPNALALDDFQIYTPTDTIGQHIHLVKFDVTSSDGSGNGWNYEDGTYSPEEVRERLHAINTAREKAGLAKLPLKTHPLFAAACAAGDMRCLALKEKGTCPANANDMPLKELAVKHPFCGAQRTVQRWYADPILDPKVAPGYKMTGRDYTLRTVFTHDHFGPSSHQQHGLYAALIVEPSNSIWLTLGASALDWNKLCSSDTALNQAERAKVLGGANLSDKNNIDIDGACSQRAQVAEVGPKELREPLKLRDDGGPTSSRANIISPLCLSGELGGGSRKNSNPLDPNFSNEKVNCPQLRTKDTRREFAVAFADFAVLYNTALEPINPEERDISALRFGRRQVPLNKPMPLAISSEDPGTQLINYRNEPVPLRITERSADPLMGGFNYQQKVCDGDPLCTGNMANVFSTRAHANRDRQLATQNYGAIMSPTDAGLLASTPVADKVTSSLVDIERWRKEFNCALYPSTELTSGCRLKQLEPWRVMGDPATPILPAYEGDPLYIRLIQGSQEAQHVFASTGYKWLRQPDVPNSGYVNAQSLGISEHFEFDIKVSPLSVERLDSMYLGSSIDQLWDGMWGLVRSYGTKQDEENTTPVPSLAKPGLARLNALPGNPLPLPAAPVIADRELQVCAPGNKNTAYLERSFFDISVVRACDLTGTCGQAGQKGIAYNRRLQLDDPNAIVYVRNNHKPGDNEPRNHSVNERNDQILARLQNEIKTGQRRLEPMVLRAPAGSCMEVMVRNHLPPILPDGPVVNGRETTAHFSDNFMSMILDGFNYNQFRMSSSVGLSAPMVANYSPLADGANFGVNSLQAQAAADSLSAAPRGPRPGRPATARGATPSGGGVPQPSLVKPQGNLVMPCREGGSDDQCTSGPMLWYAGEYELDASGKQLSRPIELGALPLSSYGDVVKHPAHGVIGALVVGPAGSRVCASNDPRERLADRATNTSATICTGDGKRYRDFVVVLQDAVDAKIRGDRVANLKGAEEPDDYGIKAANYRSEPLWGRRGQDPSIEFEERNEFDFAGVLSSKAISNNLAQKTVAPDSADALLRTKGFKQASALVRCQAGVALLWPLSQEMRHACDPETPLFVAQAGSQVRLRVVHPGGHTRQQAFTLHGHDWNPMPWADASQSLAPTHAQAMSAAWTAQGSFNGVGPMMAANLLVQAGGRYQVPMDYLWRSQASFVYDGGIWGLLRVLP